MDFPARPWLAAYLSILTCGGMTGALQSSGPSEKAYAETFDTHWETLRDGYAYFELYGVDWDAERAEHRPRAVAAASDTEFAWELARMVAALPDPHVAFVPAVKTMAGKWSVPDLDAKLVERRPFVIGWPEDQAPEPPAALASDPYAYPEVLEIQGLPPTGAAQILAAGPLGTTLDLRLRWPDGTEVVHELRRPDESNLPPPSRHLGEGWLVTGRVGSVGYLAVKSFDPQQCTLGPDGKMTTMLRAALAELSDTDALILDFQGNGGGLVAASDPFLGNLLEKTRRYRWGNSGGQSRVIRPRKPRYKGTVIAIVDEKSASGGEWAPRILHDAGRAIVVGGRTVGAEAAVHRSNAPDGSVIHYSAQPMAQPGVTPFQEKGIEVDHFLPLSIAALREHGYEGALARVRKARYSKALELAGGPASDLDALLELAEGTD